MHPQIPVSPGYVLGVICILAGISAFIIVFSKLFTKPNVCDGHYFPHLPLTSKFDIIPTVGSGGWLGSWWVGHKFQMHATEIVQEGYEKYKPAPFKIADRYRWIVILSSREHMDEIRRAPGDALSFYEGANDTIKMKYTIGTQLLPGTYHIEVIRSHLTRNIATLYDEMRDEIKDAFRDELDLRNHEWKGVPAMGAIQKIVSRTSNRMFVGLPLCRDSEWLSLNLRFAFDVVSGAYIIDQFPRFLAPIVAYFVTDPQGHIERAIKCLGPTIEKRLKQLEVHGRDWADKPNDVLSWFLDLAPEGPERTVRLLTTHVLSINFAAVHASSVSFTHALFLLAENPQYVQPLREEVESIVKNEGWSKASLAKMRKIDSFLREVQRLFGVSSLGLRREAVKDFTFSDGTFIPKGTTVFAPAQSLHRDDEHYPNAHVFDPFRFSDMRDQDGGGTKHQYVSTSLEYLPFGHGKHACPGRFFAANELKSMLAHIVVSYDVKLEDDKPRPREMRIGSNIIPDPVAKIMFRNRVY